MNTRRVNVQMLVMLSLLVAIEVILSRFLSVAAWNIKIGFAFVPLALAAIIYGPVAGGIVGALADFLGAILFPIGTFFPGFTVTAFLMGAMFGLCLYKKQSVVRIAIAVSINQFIFGLLLNSFWISILYGSPYIALLGTRIFQSLLMTTVQFIVIGAIVKLLKSFIGKQTAKTTEKREKESNFF